MATAPVTKRRREKARTWRAGSLASAPVGAGRSGVVAHPLCRPGVGTGLRLSAADHQPGQGSGGKQQRYKRKSHGDHGGIWVRLRDLKPSQARSCCAAAYPLLHPGAGTLVITLSSWGLAQRAESAMAAVVPSQAGSPVPKQGHHHLPGQPAQGRIRLPAGQKRL